MISHFSWMGTLGLIFGLLLFVSSVIYFIHDQFGTSTFASIALGVAGIFVFTCMLAFLGESCR